MPLFELFTSGVLVRSAFGDDINGTYLETKQFFEDMNEVTEESLRVVCVVVKYLTVGGYLFRCWYSSLRACSGRFQSGRGSCCLCQVEEQTTYFASAEDIRLT